MGVASVVPPVLLSEIATAETRGTITTLHQAPILYIHLFSFNRSILGGVDVGDFHCICVGLRHGDLCQPWLAIRAGKQRTNIYMWVIRKRKLLINMLFLLRRMSLSLQFYQSPLIFDLILVASFIIYDVVLFIILYFLFF